MKCCSCKKKKKSFAIDRWTSHTEATRFFVHLCFIMCKPAWTVSTLEVRDKKLSLSLVARGVFNCDSLNNINNVDHQTSGELFSLHFILRHIESQLSTHSFWSTLLTWIDRKPHGFYVFFNEWFIGNLAILQQYNFSLLDQSPNSQFAVNIGGVNCQISGWIGDFSSSIGGNYFMPYDTHIAVYLHRYALFVIYHFATEIKKGKNPTTTCPSLPLFLQCRS